MAEFITAISTDQGIKKIDYNALANLPTTDTTLTLSGQAADALAVGEAINTISTNVQNTMATKEQVSSLSNPNLLINSDFRNPINQRGLTTYTGSAKNVYAIDRWYLNATDSGRTLEVLDGYIKYTNPNATYQGFLLQRFDVALPEDYYTITVNVKSVSGDVWVGDLLEDGSGGTIWGNSVSFKLQAGINTFTVHSACLGVYLQASIESNIELYWIKLELGKLSTPFVPKSYYEEMLLCTKYYRTFIGVIGSVSVLDSTYAFLPIEIGGMRTSPIVGYTDGTMKINIKGTDYVVSSITSNKNSTGGVVLLSLGVTGLTSDCVGCAGVALMNNEGISDISLYNKLTLDAEIY